jgi:replicative DNA helicase
VGHDYINEVDARYSVTARNVKETPWPALNEITDGGFGKGELIIVAAPPGIGKSWWLVNIAAHLLTKKANVVYFSLELNESYVGLRHDAVITGYPLQDLKFHIDDVKQAMGNLKGKLFVQYYPTRSATINTLRAYLERQRLIGNRIDAVVVDYADLLRGDSKKARHEELEEIIIDLRGLAGEYEVPLFTASQINRSGAEEEVITGDKIAGSFSKLMTADFVISLSRKLEDKMTGTGRFYLIKNRFGPDGITFPSKMSLSSGRMEIFQPTSVEGKSTKRQSETGTEMTRQFLGQKYKELNGDF